MSTETRTFAKSTKSLYYHCKLHHRTTIASYKQKLQEKSAEMEQWDKILCDKHMHPDVYNLSEFIPMPNGEYMLISTPKSKQQYQRPRNRSPLARNNCWQKHQRGKGRSAWNEAKQFHCATSPVVNSFIPTVNNRVKARACASSLVRLAKHLFMGFWSLDVHFK